MLYKKQIFYFIVSAFIFCFSGPAGYAAEVTLSWEKPDDSRVSGYHIYYGESGTDFKDIPAQSVDSADTTSREISGLSEGQTYSFAATSFDDNGNESDFSETIDYTVKDSSPDPMDVDDDGDGYTENEGDCDDTDPDIYPGAEEICGDGIDQDCDGSDQQCPEDIDDDGDGYTENEGDCDDSDPDVYPGAEEICGDGIDQNCDGSDELCPEDIDNDGDGYTENEGDCDDTDPDIYPGAEEICGDGIDQDCDGSDRICEETTDDEDDPDKDSPDSQAPADEQEAGGSGDPEPDEDGDLYHAISFFHNGEFGTEYLSHGFEEGGGRDIKAGAGDNNEVLSRGGDFFIIPGEKDYPSATLGLRYTPGITAADFAGDYRIFIITAANDSQGAAKIKRGTITSDGRNYLSAKTGEELEFSAFYHIDDKTGHMIVEPEAGLSDMEGGICAQGRVFAAAGSDYSNATPAVIIGIRIPDDSVETSICGGYYVNEFSYAPAGGPAGGFLELCIEENMDYETREIESTTGALREAWACVMTMDESGLIKAVGENGEEEFAGSAAPDGELIVLQNDSFLGMGIRQSSNSLDSQDAAAADKGDSSSAGGCFVRTLLPAGLQWP